MPVPFAELAEGRVGGSAVRIEEQPLALAGGIEQIVDVERDRGPRAGAVFDEGGAIGSAVEPTVDLVRAEKAESVAVVDAEPVGEGTRIAAQFDAPLPVGKEVAEIAEFARDWIMDAGPLKLPVDLQPRPTEAEALQRRIDVDRHEAALAGAEIAGRAKPVFGQYLVLEPGDAVEPQVDLD